MDVNLHLQFVLGSHVNPRYIPEWSLISWIYCFDCEDILEQFHILTFHF